MNCPDIQSPNLRAMKESYKSIKETHSQFKKSMNIILKSAPVTPWDSFISQQSPKKKFNKKVIGSPKSKFKPHLSEDFRPSNQLKPSSTVPIHQNLFGEQRKVFEKGEMQKLENY